MAKVRQWLYLKDEEGAPLEDAYLQLYLTGTETPATIFSDSIGTSLDQSTWTTGSSGFFDFYIGNEWDAQGYVATQFFDLAWQSDPFEYVIDGDMETDPTNNWSGNNVTLTEETTIINSGSKSLKIADIGSASYGYQSFTTEVGKGYSVTGYIYNPSVADIESCSIFAGSSLGSQSYNGKASTIYDSWELVTFNFTATTITTYIHLYVRGKVDDGTDYAFFDDISIVPISSLRSGLIDKIQLFPFLFSVDETDTDTIGNKLLSNQFAYKFENHVGLDYQSEPHDIEPVDTSLKDTKNNKVVSNALIEQINSLLDILLASGGNFEEVDEKKNIKTVLLDTFTPSAGVYYTDLLHTIDRKHMYPVLQFYEYLKGDYAGFYGGREPIRTHPSAGSFEIIHPIALQDISPSGLRVWTVDDNWLMATVVASGADYLTGKDTRWILRQ